MRSSAELGAKAITADEHDRPAKRQKLECLFRFSNAQRQAEGVRDFLSMTLPGALRSVSCAGPTRPTPRVPHGPLPAKVSSVRHCDPCPRRRSPKNMSSATRRRCHSGQRHSTSCRSSATGPPSRQRSGASSSSYRANCALSSCSRPFRRVLPDICCNYMLTLWHLGQNTIRIA